MKLKMNNSVGLFDVMVPASDKAYVVIPNEGRFVVARRTVATTHMFDVVDDCRTKAYADMRADFLNSKVTT
jgi:hypothetical protein